MYEEHMTGPEHYREAEAILGRLSTARTEPVRANLLAEAQVHATLALVEATNSARGGTYAKQSYV
ncbi:hypothetical protein [Kitasatospora sp. NPDC001175]|uniref:hypothetical protein n=1 Tax=Kitasatospora sp. NPDC001175 TaxID=3157103 RepID=UPI003D06B2C0